MTLIELHNLLHNQKQKIVLTEKNNLLETCLQCTKVISSLTIKDKKILYDYAEPFYIDGDTIEISNDYLAKVDTEMMFGKCLKCGCDLSKITIWMLDKDIEGYITTTGYENDKPNFCILNPDEMVISQKDVRICEANINNLVCGNIVYYKHAILDKAMIYDISDNLIRDVFTITLNCSGVNFDEMAGVNGIYNGHHQNTNQSNVWEMATQITTAVINQMNNIIF